jgi:hypothetical protein
LVNDVPKPNVGIETEKGGFIRITNLAATPKTHVLENFYSTMSE